MSWTNRVILSAVQNIANTLGVQKLISAVLQHNFQPNTELLLKAKLRRRQKRKSLPLKSRSTTSHLYFCFPHDIVPKRGARSWALWTERRRATHQELELAEGDGGAVEEVGRQPALVLVTVPDRRAWVDGRRREGGRE